MASKEIDDYHNWIGIHSPKLPIALQFNFQFESWTFERSIFFDPGTSVSRNKPELPHQNWEYPGRNRVSDLITTVLDDFLIKLFENNFVDSNHPYDDVYGKWCNPQDFFDLLVGKEVSTQVSVLFSFLC